MTGQKIPLKTAARIIGVSAAELRFRMETERNRPRSEQTYPIGICKRSRSGKTLQCEVYKGLLQKHLGLTDEEFEREVQE